MGCRDGVTDPWLQRHVTVPSREALETYRNGLQLFKERWVGEPPASRTIRQVFKQDEEVGNRVTAILQERGQVPTNKTLRVAVFAELFGEASIKLGGLDRFTHLVEKDQERYARELKEFKEKMLQFDRDTGLVADENSNESIERE